MSRLSYRIRDKIKQKFGTIEAFAKEYGKSVSTVSKKLNGNSELKTSEIEQFCKILEIPIDKIGEYFFCK